ncbi:MAG: type VI secretion system tube protein Hcp [Rhizobacter sp.]|nr:type VI secretion system tube protein Hcp [Rhizobacter sp.]
MPSFPSSSGGGGAIDVFLSVQTKRAGKLKGESQAVDHKEEIVVHGWSWGIAASSALGSAQATGRRSYKNLSVTKRIDSASTSLMSVLATNDEVKEAKLSMRKAGEGQRDYFTIKLSNARVTSLDLECGEDGDAIERITFAFTKVQVDYELQQATGHRGGGTSFQDEILAS